jgi:hypothetical protein
MGYSHPDHGEIVEKTLNTRIHDGVEMLRCERCHVMAGVDDDPDSTFDEHDCDHYKKIQEGVTDAL